MRNHPINPNPITPSPPMLSELASDSGDGREDETAASSSSSSAVIKSDEEEEEEMEYESLEDEVNTALFSGMEIEDEQGDNREPTDEDEDRRELDAATSKSLVVAQRENAFLKTDKPPTDDCCPICFNNFVVPCRGPCGHWYCGKTFKIVLKSLVHFHVYCDCYVIIIPQGDDLFSMKLIVCCYFGNELGYMEQMDVLCSSG